MDLFNNILRGIVAINDCLGFAYKQTISRERSNIIWRFKRRGGLLRVPSYGKRGHL